MPETPVAGNPQTGGAGMLLRHPARIRHWPRSRRRRPNPVPRRHPGRVRLEPAEEKLPRSNIIRALEQTSRLIKQRGPVTLFEAAFQSDGVLIRADVLVRNEDHDYHLIEVKASTAVKEYQLHDCAIQLGVLQQQGFNVASVQLAHINNEFVYPGGGDYDGLFSLVDVTEDARNLQENVTDLIDDLRQTLSRTEPRVDMGDQCSDPFDCPFTGYCAGPQPELPVSWLPGGIKATRKLVDQGYTDMREIPEGHLDNQAREWVRQVTTSGKPDLRPGAAKALKGIGWPRYYLDFETLNPAVPVFEGTRPYEAQAFQWSCHIEQENGDIEHREFLADGSEPPTRQCAISLIKTLGTEGPILAYSSYEKTTLSNLAALYPRRRIKLEAIKNRLVDLLPITKANYYHPDMQGSWSIKRVIPTIAPELDYADLDIVSEGSQAQVAFLEMIEMDEDPDRKEELETALLRYCEMDTLAMVRLVQFLEGR